MRGIASAAIFTPQHADMGLNQQQVLEVLSCVWRRDNKSVVLSVKVRSALFC